MKTSKPNLYICLAAIMVIAVAFPGRASSKTASLESCAAGSPSATPWSVQVERIDPSEIQLDSSFQVATYENLIEELKKTHQFKNVFREGDPKASQIPDLLVLKTAVVKYTAGSETQRAVTTVTGATKLSVRNQLVTPDGKVVLDRTVDGKVRFFGSNFRVTHNLARSVAKMIKESSCLRSEQASATPTGQPAASSSQGELR